MPLDAGPAKLALGPYAVDLEARKVMLQDKEVRLHWRSFEALRILIEANGNAVSRDRLIELLWSGAAVEESNLHKYVSALRKALSAGDSGREYVETIPRIGYRLTVPACPWTEAPQPAPPPSRRLAMRRFLIPGLAVLALAGSLAAAGYWRMARTGAQTAESERSYHAGLDLLRQRTFTSVRQGTAELRRAVELRSDFALAWAGLAESAAIGGIREPGTAVEFAERAVRLDPECGECHATLGFVRGVMQWNWQPAGDSLRRGLALKPDDPQVVYWFAQREIALGRGAHAIQVIDAALGRHPQALNLYNLKAAALYFSRDFEGAVRAADKALTVKLAAGWHWRSKALLLLRNYPEAIRALVYDQGEWTVRSQEAVAQRADAFVSRFYDGGLDRVLHDLLEASSQAEGLVVQAESRARWYMLLRQPDEAVRSLETAVQARVFDVIYLGVDPIFDPIRNRPAFQSLLKKLGLAP